MYYPANKISGKSMNNYHLLHLKYEVFDRYGTCTANSSTCGLSRTLNMHEAYITVYNPRAALAQPLATTCD